MRPAATRTSRACPVRSSSAASPQSTASTLLPFDPGRFHHLPSTPPRAVRAALRLQDVERVCGARIIETGRDGQRPQPGEEVVVPVGRVVELHQLGMRRLASAVGEDNSVPQEELRTSGHRLVRAVRGEPRIGPHVSLKDECVTRGRTSQFQPPSGHSVSTNDSASVSTRGSSRKPRYRHAWRARPSCEAQRRTRPSMRSLWMAASRLGLASQSRVCSAAASAAG